MTAVMADASATRVAVTPLRCPGSIWGYAIEATGHLRVRCKDRLCRVEGRATFHDFDLATGEFTTAHEVFRPLSELLRRPEETD